MTARHGTTSDRGAPGASTAAIAWQKAVAWILGIAAAVAVFCGMMILFAGDDQYLGISGDVSWRIGDIAPAWGYALLIGGGVLLLAVLGWALLRRDRR